MKILLCMIFISLCALVPNSSNSAYAQRPGTAEPGKAQTPGKKQPQTPESPAPPMPVLPDVRSDPDVQDADIAIIANITAKELRFDVVPNSTVEFPGKLKSTTIWHADRYNLPDTVQPGVTYRNIGIRLKIVSRFADIDRIVAEALGEVPVNDSDKKPEPQSNPAPTSDNKVTPRDSKKPPL